jgi:hypothetical protein
VRFTALAHFLRLSLAAANPPSPRRLVMAIRAPGGKPVTDGRVSPELSDRLLGMAVATFLLFRWGPSFFQFLSRKPDKGFGGLLSTLDSMERIDVDIWSIEYAGQAAATVKDLLDLGERQRSCA